MAKSELSKELYNRLDEARCKISSGEDLEALSPVVDWALTKMSLLSFKLRYRRYINMTCGLGYRQLHDCLKSKGLLKPKVVGVPKELDIKVKKIYEDAKLPTKAHPTDAGWDLYVYSGKLDSEKGLIVYELGIAVEIPEGHVGLIFPRSSIYKTQLNLSNCVGVVDSGYRGQIKAMFRFNWWKFIRVSERYGIKIQKKFPWVTLSKFEGEPDPAAMMWLKCSPEIYHKGERCCQMIIMPYPRTKMTEVTELSESDRNSSGFGGSGR